MTPRALSRLLAPLRRRVMLSVARGVLRLVADGPRVQEVQIGLLAGETLDGVERFQEYGFSSHPHAGAEAVTVCVGGSRNHALVVAVDDRRFRLVGQRAGEVALYDDLGQVVRLTRDGIAIASPATIALTAPTLTLDGEVAITGGLTVAGDIAAGGGVSAAGAVSAGGNVSAGGSVAAAGTVTGSNIP